MQDIPLKKVGLILFVTITLTFDASLLLFYNIFRVPTYLFTKTNATTHIIRLQYNIIVIYRPK